MQKATRGGAGLLDQVRIIVILTSIKSMFVEMRTMI